MIPRIVEILNRAVDKFAGFIAVSDNDHKYIHQGKAFSVRGNTGSVAAAGTYYVTFQTPVVGLSKYVHLRPTSFAATANTTLLEIHEGSAVTNLGSAVTPINLNRNSTKTSKMVVYVGSTTVTDGTQITQAVTGSAATGVSMGGGSGTIAERVLKPGTTYTLKFTVVGATTASTAYYELFWYEEDKGQD